MVCTYKSYILNHTYVHLHRTSTSILCMYVRGAIGLFRSVKLTINYDFKIWKKKTKRT